MLWRADALVVLPTLELRVLHVIRWVVLAYRSKPVASEFRLMKSTSQLGLITRFLGLA